MPKKETPKPIDERAQWMEHIIGTAISADDNDPSRDEMPMLYIFVAAFPVDDLQNTVETVNRVEDEIRGVGSLLLAQGFMTTATKVSLGR